MPDTTTAPRLLTTRQTAAALSVCEKSVWSLTKSGRLPCVRLGRAVRYDVIDIDRFIATAKTRANPALAGSDTPPAGVGTKGGGR
jgi:predicted DNA-binding transcriptional regulator AlpA